MAENKLFRKTALETVSNPEQLDQHIRVTRPFSWVILVAIISFVIGVGIWAFTGNISSVQILAELFLHQMAYQLQMLLALVSLVMF